MFSIQSGSPFSLKKKMISDTFSHFGVIAFVFYQTGSSFGFVNFQSSEDAKNVFNKVGALPDLDQVEEPGRGSSTSRSSSRSSDRSTVSSTLGTT